MLLGPVDAKPATQFVHLEDPGSDSLPFAQATQASVDVFGALNMLAQFLHAVCPVWPMNLPGAHEMHDALPW